MGPFTYKVLNLHFSNRCQTSNSHLVHNKLKFHLEKAQAQMNKCVNRHKIPSNIKLGDSVHRKIHTHGQVSMPTRLHPKLSACYYYPYLF